MALEPITRQEQIIAGKDLEPITRMEKFLKEYGGGGGASSWNDLDDRPFGEVTTYGDTLTWDGNTDGLEVFGDVFYKVSDIVPTMEYCANGGAVTISDGRSMPFVNKEVMQDGTSILISPGGGVPFAVVVTSDADGISPGLYLVSVEGMYLTSFTINGYNGFETKVITPIDNKYLEPFETVGGDTLTWDGNTEGLVSLFGVYFRIATDSLSYTELTAGGSTTATVVMEDGSSSTQPIIDMSADLGFEAFGIGEQVVYYDQKIEDEEVVIEKGLYFMAGVRSITINGYTGFTTTKLKEEYMPNMVVDIGTPTFESDRTTVSNINYTALYEHFRQGGNVLLKFITSGVAFYGTALSMFVQDGVLGVSIWVSDTMCTVIFTTA